MPGPISGSPGVRPTAPVTTGPAGGLANERFAGDAALAKVLSGTPITRGANNPTVAKVQTALLDMGFNLKTITEGGVQSSGTSGLFGPRTELALKNFQNHAANFFPDVKPTGQLDAATLRALDKLAPKPGAKAWSPGQDCKIPSPFVNGDRTKPLRVVVLKNEHRTFVFDKQGKCTGIYANATGAQATATDEGIKKVTSKLGEEAARAAGQSLWNAPNAFGPRIVDLSWEDGRRSGEELHGTGKESDQGKDVSHGCVRHYNDDIKVIFDQLAVGDRVAIVNAFNDPRIKAPAN